jgi:hypothetical protein
VLHTVRHSHSLQRFLRAPPAFRAPHAAISQRQFDILVYGQIADQIECLEYEPNLAIADARAR